MNNPVQGFRVKDGLSCVFSGPQRRGKARNLAFLDSKTMYKGTAAIGSQNATLLSLSASRNVHTVIVVGEADLHSGGV